MKLNHEEKEVILLALDELKNQTVSAGRRFAQKPAELMELEKTIQALHEMIMVATYKITEVNNGCLVRVVCPICGIYERPDGPYWGEINGELICSDCMEKHLPGTVKKNEEYWMQKHSETNEPVTIDVDGSLPF